MTAEEAAKLVGCRSVEQRLKALHEMGYGTDYDQHRQQFAQAWIAARATLGGSASTTPPPLPSPRS
jgi:hypothetical protein